MSNFFLVACPRWANVGPPVKKPLGQRRQPSSGRRMCRRWPNVSMLSGYQHIVGTSPVLFSSPVSVSVIVRTRDTLNHLVGNSELTRARD